MEAGKDIYITILVAVVIIILAYIWVTKPQCEMKELQGVWYIPAETADLYGLSEHILYLGDEGDGYLVMVDESGEILYNDTIIYNFENEQLTIKTEKEQIFPQKLSVKFSEEGGVKLMSLEDNSELMGIFIKVEDKEEIVTS